MDTNLSLLDKIKFVGKGLPKALANELLVASFEVTLSCVCNCKHCDLGGPVKGEKRIKPKEYGRLVRELEPLVIQISGGEPLLRPDILEIVRSIKQFGSLPYEILVSNAWLLDEKKYLRLKEAGVNQFSISLDFPDRRHDDFRRRPGLYKHLSETLPRLAKHRYNDIIMNSAITRANFKELIPLAKKAKEWGVLISYSAYTSLRTGNKEYSFETKKDIKALKEAMKELIEYKKEADNIVTQKGVLLDVMKFFEEKYVPNCQAGIKFVVVMPDGSLVPCSMKREKFATLEEMRQKFSRHNDCGGCYVSIRCNTERSLLRQLKDFSSYINVIGHW
jgi:MoaA/NifB/PqqE/SkfB family radical SAM enzyme